LGRLHLREQLLELVELLQGEGERTKEQDLRRRWDAPVDCGENQGEEQGFGDQLGYIGKIEKDCWIKPDLSLRAMVG
jgi:hypothetical protein